MLQPGYLAGLECLVKEGEPKGDIIILLHGYGANAADLAPFSQILKTPSQVTWIFPNGPLSIPIPGGEEGRAWFPIDENELMQAMMRGSHRDFSQMTPPGFKEASDLVLKLVAETHADTSKIILCGFSQGAMLAVNVALWLDKNIKGLIALSGNLVCEEEWKKKSLNHKGLSFFQSHGKQDPLLDFESAVKLNELLNQSGLKGDLVAFDGEHEIPEMVIDKLQLFLDSIF